MSEQVEMEEEDKGNSLVTTNNQGGEKKRFEVKKVAIFYILTLIFLLEIKKNSFKTYFKWNAVALWAWDIVVDNCAICRNHIMDLCNCYKFLKVMIICNYTIIRFHQ